MPVNKSNLQNIGISTDSVSDLPRFLAESEDIGIIRFYVTTETGVFRDGDEISSQNVAEYYRKGGASLMTSEASVDEFAEFFRERLEYCDILIHISVSSGISGAYENARAALVKLGMLSRRVRLIDSLSLSAGIAHLVMIAARMRNEGRDAQEIVSAVEDSRRDMYVSFIVRSPEQMFRNGRMNRAAGTLCRAFRVHPVFCVKNGRIKLCGIGAGNMSGAVRRYIRRRLRHRAAIDTRRLFVSHAGCSIAEISAVEHEVARSIDFDEITVTDASATVAGNCGAGTVGLMYIKASRSG